MSSFTLIVSVIMPVYNAEFYLKQAIDSMLNQTYANIEILIADDCSTDTSRQIIDSYRDNEKIRIFHNSVNIGYLKTCNNLFEKAKGKFIAFQDADDWSEPDRIEKTILEFEKNQNLGLCGCNFVRKDDKSKRIISYSNFPVEHNLITEYARTHKQPPFCGASVIVKKNVYDEIGGYRTFFDRIGYEHFDWFMLIMEKFEVGNIEDSLYNYRYVKNSFSRSNKIFDYKKFYVKEIAWFLKTQRDNHGFDALQSQNYRQEFLAYLNEIEHEFWNNRKKVYNSIIFQNLSNKEFKEALVVAFAGLRKREIDINDYVYYVYRVFRSGIKTLFKK